MSPNSIIQPEWPTKDKVDPESSLHPTIGRFRALASLIFKDLRRMGGGLWLGSRRLSASTNSSDKGQPHFIFCPVDMNTSRPARFPGWLRSSAGQNREPGHDSILDSGNDARPGLGSPQGHLRRLRVVRRAVRGNAGQSHRQRVPHTGSPSLWKPASQSGGAAQSTALSSSRPEATSARHR